MPLWLQLILLGRAPLLTTAHKTECSKVRMCFVISHLQKDEKKMGCHLIMTRLLFLYLILWSKSFILGDQTEESAGEQQSEEERGGGERRKWSLVVTVNEEFCSHGSNKSQACSHTGVLPHAVLASCWKMPFFFSIRHQFTAQCIFWQFVLALKFKPPAWTQVEYGRW